MRMVDPPEGWRHGFPAPLQDDYRKQLLDANYPYKMIDMAMSHSRFWDENDEPEAVNGRLA